MITRYPFPRRKLYGALFTLYLFLLMYLSRDSQAGLYLLGFYRAQFLSMAVTALAALALLFYNRKRIPEILTDGRIVLAILFSLTILIRFFRNGFGREKKPTGAMEKTAS